MKNNSRLNYLYKLKRIALRVNFILSAIILSWSFFIILPAHSYAWPPTSESILIYKQGALLPEPSGDLNGSGENNKIKLSSSLQNIPQYIEAPPDTEGNRIISCFFSDPLCSSKLLLLKMNNISQLPSSYWPALCIYCLNYSILLKIHNQEQEKLICFHCDCNRIYSGEK
jgi:hypothetical protein